MLSKLKEIAYLYCFIVPRPFSTIPNKPKGALLRVSNTGERITVLKQFAIARMHRAFAIDSVKRLAIVVLITTRGKLFSVIVFFV